MSNNLRTRNGLPYNFVNGLKVRGMDIESLIPGIEGIPEAGSKYQFAGNGSNKAFTLPVTPYNKDAVDVYVKQLYVHPDDYTLVGDTITLTEAPPAVVAGETYNVVVKVSLTTLNGYVNANRVSFEGENLDDILEKGKPLANYSALRAYAGAATQVRITDPGIAGFFYYDAADTTSTDNGGTVIVSGNGKRWKRKFDGSVCLAWFLPVGDGIANDSAAIIAADAYAASVSRPLNFPDGVFRAYGLSASTSWSGNGATVIKNNDRSGSSSYGFMQINGQTNLRFKGIVFDGWVTDDPATGWTSSNYNSFQGRIACFVYNSTNLRFDDCEFRNSYFSPLRIENCSDIKVTGCVAKRGRGNFGDCVYTRNSRDIEFIDCFATDGTRIGFVAEGGCVGIRYTNTHAFNMHDKSVNYGGGEYNAGFWAENSSSITNTACTARSCGYAFLNTSGTVTPYGAIPTHTLVNCEAIGPGTGFVGQSTGATPVHITYQGCKSFGCKIAYTAKAVHDTDTFIYEGCHAEVIWQAGGINAAFLWGLEYTSFIKNPLFSYTDCTVNQVGLVQADVDNNGNASADLTTVSGGPARIYVSNMRNIDSTIPINIKQRYSAANTTIYEIDNTDFHIADAIACATFDSVNSDIKGIGGSIQPTTRFSFSSGTIGSCNVSGPAKIMFSDFVLEPGAGSLNIYNPTSTREPMIFLRDGFIKKDIATNDYAIRIQCEGASKPGVMLQDITMYNSGGATSVKTFLWVVRLNHVLSYSGCFSDSNVTYIQKIENGIGNPATGNTLTTMH